MAGSARLVRERETQMAHRRAWAAQARVARGRCERVRALSAGCAPYQALLRNADGECPVLAEDLTVY